MAKTKYFFQMYQEYKIQGYTESQLRILCRMYDRQVRTKFINELRGLTVNDSHTATKEGD